MKYRKNSAGAWIDNKGHYVSSKKQRQLGLNDKHEVSVTFKLSGEVNLKCDVDTYLLLMSKNEDS